jgi:hypothetical protein
MRRLTANLHPNPVDAKCRMELLASLVKGICIAAWGIHGKWQRQDEEVVDRFKEFNVPLYMLGMTKKGHPRHPLYVKSSGIPERWMV